MYSKKWKFNCNTVSLVNCATVSNGEIGFCYCNTCSENEGDCDSHDKCQDSLGCGSNNCPASLGFDSEIDCCSSTQIMSPNYPNSYPNNAEETWLLTAPTGSIITLQFHSFHVRLIVESKSRTKWELIFSLLQTENNYDFVTIYDGPNDQSTQIEKLSGNLGSFSISSTGNSLFVKFESDGSVSKDGFLATIHYGNPYFNIK